MGGGTTDPALRAALDRAAAFGIGREARRALRGSADGPRFVHEQIAGTLLARRLAFVVDGVAGFECDVADCRLLRFGAQGQPGAEGGFDDLSDEAAVGDALGAFARMVAVACDGAGEISVRSSALTRVPGGGVSADKVAEGFGLLTGPVPPRDWIQNYLDQAGRVIQAAAFLEDDLLYPLKGEEPQLDLLAQALEDSLPGIDDLPGWQSGGDTGDALLILGQSPGAEADILYVLHGGLHVFALVALASQPPLVRLWHELRVFS